MLLQKIKNFFFRLNFFLRKTLIPKVLNILMSLALGLVYLMAVGFTALILRTLRLKQFSKKTEGWHKAQAFDNALERARRQS